MRLAILELSDNNVYDFGHGFVLVNYFFALSIQLRVDKVTFLKRELAIYCLSTSLSNSAQNETIKVP